MGRVGHDKIRPCTPTPKRSRPPSPPSAPPAPSASSPTAPARRPRPPSARPWGRLEPLRNVTDPEAVLTALANAPALLVPLILEVPPEMRNRRPARGKWSVHEHACHLAEAQP